MSKSKIPKHIRSIVAKRAKWNCEYCVSQERFAPQPFTVDHFDPESNGGDSDLNNLVYCCQGCNGAKSDKTRLLDPVIKNYVSLFNPRKQRWNDHFAWDDEFSHIIGLTPEGRVTVIALQLNRRILIELRKFLHSVGEHPPFGAIEDAA